MRSSRPENSVHIHIPMDTSSKRLQLPLLLNCLFHVLTTSSPPSSFLIFTSFFQSQITFDPQIGKDKFDWSNNSLK